MLYFGVYLLLCVLIALFVIIELVDAKLETAKRECKSYDAVVRCKDKIYNRDWERYEYSCNIVANNGKSHIFEGYENYMNLYQGQKVILLEHIIYGKNDKVIKRFFEYQINNQ